MSGTRDLSLPQYLWKAQRPPPAVGEGDPDGPDTPVLPRPLWVSSTTATPPKPFTVRTASATKTESRQSGLVNKAFSYKRPLFSAQKALFLCHLCNLSRPSIQKSHTSGPGLGLWSAGLGQRRCLSFCLFMCCVYQNSYASTAVKEKGSSTVYVTAAKKLPSCQLFLYETHATSTPTHVERKASWLFWQDASALVLKKCDAMQQSAKKRYVSQLSVFT